MKDRYKNILEKREPKYEKSSNKWSKNEAKIHQKSFQNRCEKRDEKRRSKTWHGGMRVVPKPNHFKRILRKKTHEESRMRGEYKVECKKWSAKGKCRKASADREPTTHANTLGGQRPRADRLRAFPLARVSGCFVRQLPPKLNKNGTQIDHKWDQSGPGGEGATENQRKYEKV